MKSRLPVPRLDEMEIAISGEPMTTSEQEMLVERVKRGIALLISKIWRRL